MTSPAWRVVVVGEGSHLSYGCGQMIVRTQEKGEETIPLFDVRTILVSSSRSSLTTQLILELHERQIRLIFCDSKRSPYGEIVGYYDHHAVPRCLKEQISWSEQHCREIWRQIVFLKLRMQENLLRHLGLAYDDTKWQSYQKTLEAGDRSNREGQAARLYFNALFGKKFHRRKASPINAALNYGYAILCSTVTRALAIHGYHPSLGIAHCGATNPYNLSYDLMEPFRPCVDEMVWKRQGEELSCDFKKELIGVTHRKVLYTRKRMTLDSAVDQFVLDMTKALKKGTHFKGELDFDVCEKP
ncbi:MAG: type II CRISPR-associated endonuclease Cas1 [Planctomycetia bacterium]|nr:type II CRISPR-associated endonuclease Cas1 [Planctomycetia bacterium]